MKKWKQICCVLALLAGLSLSSLCPFKSSSHMNIRENRETEEGKPELSAEPDSGTADSDSPAKKPGSPAEESGSPAEESDSPAKKPDSPAEESDSPAEESDSQAADRVADSPRETGIVYNNQYEMEIAGAREAREAIAAEAELQRKTYDNPDIRRIESAMEEKYGVFHVTLGEMKKETAEKVEAAFSYMYETYPVLRGRLTNLTLGNIEGGFMAVTQYRDFISPKEGIYPIVMKQEIVLNARDFLNESRLANLIRKSVSEGYWVKDTNIEALVVHELGHVLVNEIRMERYGLSDFYYITEKNKEAYAAYNTDVLAENQTTAREILENAYDKYQEKSKLDFEKSCASISGYAKGIQADGGISYEETCAEAAADFYLHGESANGFSIQIVDEMKAFLE